MEYKKIKSLYSKKTMAQVAGVHISTIKWWQLDNWIPVWHDAKFKENIRERIRILENIDIDDLLELIPKKEFLAATGKKVLDDESEDLLRVYVTAKVHFMLSIIGET